MLIYGYFCHNILREWRRVLSVIPSLNRLFAFFCELREREVGVERFWGGEELLKGHWHPL
jgi:hypothetical protein